MEEAILDVKKWGNNLGVRLPSAIAKASNISEHQKVKLSVLNGQIIITPIIPNKLDLEQCLAEYDVHKHGTEVMVTDHAVGEEFGSSS